MKLVIQIPCYNEAETLPKTLCGLPRELAGIDAIEVLIIDDGSQDDTVGAARQAGVNHIIRLGGHKGLAAAFRAGLDASLYVGADIIVNTDADNQYDSADIESLIRPILAGQAEIVIGDRGVESVEDFSPIKRRLQALGSRVLAEASGLDIPDATSGFRAYTREAALRTNVLSDYSYTLETLIAAGAHKMAVTYIPVRTNRQTRPSRLMRSISQYLLNSGVTILRSYTMYRPLRVFSTVGLVFVAAGLLLGLRYLVLMLMSSGAGHVQSVIVAGVLTTLGVQIWLIGLLADLVSFNRKMLEEILYRQKNSDLQSNDDLPKV